MTLYEAETLRREHTLLTGGRTNSRAFIKLMKLCRPIDNLDDNSELDSWRQEKFIHESIN